MGTSVVTMIAPWLSVENATKAVAFYASAFGATEAYRLGTPDGAVMVARLSVDGAEFWVGEEAGAASDTHPVRMILTVADPAAVFARALHAGASEINPVGEEHGWRIGRLSDPFGHHWEVGRPLDA